MPTLGVVPYVNAVPLLAGLEERARLVVDLPAALAERLRRGEIDAGLVPVAEALRGAGAGFLGRHGIASEGPVASVLLFLRRPLPRVRTVLLDPASRTSAALARYVVGEAAGEDVTFREAATPGPDPATASEDAVLVIGDPALDHRQAWTGAVLDLGEAWTRRTGLPFVFARWTARAGLAAAERASLAETLDRAADEGLPRRAERVRAWAAARGRDGKRAVEYVQRHVRYRIGPREEEGLERFAAILRAQDEAARTESSHA
jgi:chorismate dehydratase